MTQPMQIIRQQLREFKNHLENDSEEFNSKLNLTRKHVTYFLDQQIEYLTKVKNEYNDEFDYLDEQNKKTCADNQYEFDKLCLTINKHDSDLTVTQKLLNDFKQKFPFRSKMIKSIPEFQFKDIQIEDLMTKQDFHLSPPSSSTATESPDHYSTSIDESQDISPTSASTSSSNDKHFIQQSCDNEVEPESCSAPACKTKTYNGNTLNIIRKISYQHKQKPHLICFNNDEDYYLIFSFSTRRFLRLSSDLTQSDQIDYPIDKSIISIDYSSIYRSFYCCSKYESQFVLFQIDPNKPQPLQIIKEFELVPNTNDRLLNAHLFENIIFSLYLTQSNVNILGKYDIDQSKRLEPSRLTNQFYENQKKLSYKILDFTVNRSFICFLIQMKSSNRSQIHIHDHQTLSRINLFDLIDAVKPLTIISTKKITKTSITTMSNDVDDTGLLLYVNDPQSGLVHCCTYQEYLIPTKIVSFGMCLSSDGNVLLIASNDIRILNVQDFFESVK